MCFVSNTFKAVHEGEIPPQALNEFLSSLALGSARDIKEKCFEFYDEHEVTCDPLRLAQFLSGDVFHAPFD